MEILLILPGFILATIIIVMYEIELRKSQNKVHFYVARDKNKELTLWLGKPFRGIDSWTNVGYSVLIAIDDELNIYGVNSSDFDNLKWEDEPKEVFLNLED